jgi:hypothetical protein
MIVIVVKCPFGDEYKKKYLIYRDYLIEDTCFYNHDCKWKSP